MRSLMITYWIKNYYSDSKRNNEFISFKIIYIRAHSSFGIILWERSKCRTQHLYVIDLEFR